jgi:hypothetical protein
MSEKRSNAFGPEKGYTPLGDDPKYAHMIPVLDENGLLDASLFNVDTGSPSGGLLNTQGFYYIDVVNGNDITGDGSISLPFQTINAAIAADIANAGSNTTVVLSLVGFEGTNYAAGATADNRHEKIVIQSTLGNPATVDSFTFNNAPAGGNVELVVMQGVKVSTTSSTDGSTNYIVDCKEGGFVNAANTADTGEFYSYGTLNPALSAGFTFNTFINAGLVGYTPTTPGDWTVVPSLVKDALDTLANDILNKLNVAVGPVAAGEIAVFDDATGDNISSSSILASALYTTIGDVGGGLSIVDNSAAPNLTFNTFGDNAHPALTFTEIADVLTVSFLPGNLNHDELAGIGDDDHTQYVHISTDRTISATHTFNPGVVGVPFVLGPNAVDQLVTGLNAEKLSGNIASDAVWNAGFADSIEIDNAGITDGQYMSYDLAQNKFLPASPLNPDVAQFNADEILGRAVNDTNIGDGRVLTYDLGTNQIVYTDVLNPAVAQFNANRIQDILVDVVGIGDGAVLAYDLGSNTFLPSTLNDKDIAQFNADRIQGKTVDDSAISDTRVLAYDLGSDSLIYRYIPPETMAAFNANQIQSKTVNNAAIADRYALIYDAGGDEIIYASVPYDEAGTVAIERRYIIDDIDLKTLANHPVLTVPVGQRMVIDEIQVLIKDASGVSVAAEVSAGITGDLIKYVVVTDLGGASITSGNRIDLAIANLAQVSAGEELTFSVTQVATATGAHTATVMFRGTILI